MNAFTLWSNNQVKRRALESALLRIGQSSFSIDCQSGDSGVSAQPLNLEETLRGSRNRAEQAFAYNQNSAGVGIECGVFQIAPVERLFNISAAVIFNGQRYFTGLSPAFLHPAQITQSVLLQKQDISQAYKSCGLTENENIGSAGGAIALISNNHMNREAYCSLAVEMALYDYFYEKNA